MTLRLFFAVIGLVLASSTSSENSRTQLLSSDDKLNKQKGSDSLLNKLKFARGAAYSTSPEILSVESTVPLRKTQSDSLPLRHRRTISPSLSPSDEEFSPLHSVVEPRPALLTDSPKTIRQRSRGSKKSREFSSTSTKGKYDGMTRDELLFMRTEKKMQYLYAKAQYSKAKLEYYEIKQHLLDTQI